MKFTASLDDMFLVIAKVVAAMAYIRDGAEDDDSVALVEARELLRDAMDDLFDAYNTLGVQLGTAKQ